MLTTVMWIQGEGAFVTVERVRSDARTTTLHARVPPGFDLPAGTVWAKVKK